MTARWPRSLRARAAWTAGVAVLLGSVLVAAVAVMLVQAASTRSLDAALAASTSDVIAQLEENPPTSGDPVQLPAVDPSDPVVVQIVSAAGGAVATTPGVDPSVRICPAATGVDDATTVDLAEPGLVGTFRIVATPTTAGGSVYVVCAARSTAGTETSRWVVLLALLVVVVAVTVLVVLLVARGVGTALGAVARLTAEADRLRTLDAGRLGVPDSGDEVARLAVTLNELLDRLHDQQQATRQFVADAGHELRTPLASLRLELELAASGSGDSDSAGTGALGDVERLTALVDDLLMLARADAGERLAPAPVTLPDAIVDDVTNAGRSRDGVSVTVHGSAVQALVDVHGLRRAVRNLLSNAVRHAEAVVRVEVSLDGAWVCVEVLDDGPGVPAGETTRVFERFTRLDDARARDHGGSGLGLSIVAAFAERSGGSVIAYAGPPGRFVLRIPAVSRRP